MSANPWSNVQGEGGTGGTKKRRIGWKMCRRISCMQEWGQSVCLSGLGQDIRWAWVCIPRETCEYGVHEGWVCECMCVCSEIQVGLTGEWATYEMGLRAWDTCRDAGWTDWPCKYPVIPQMCVCLWTRWVLCVCLHYWTSVSTSQRGGVSAACVSVLCESFICKALCVCFVSAVDGSTLFVAACVTGHISVLCVCASGIWAQLHYWLNLQREK